MPGEAAFNAAEIRRAKANLDIVVGSMRRAVASEADAIGRDAVTVITSLIPIPVFPRSAPGNPPHRETGHLSGLPPSPAARRLRGRGRGQSGYQYAVDRRGIDHFTVEVGSSVEYSVYLEEGTRKMAARPHVGPGVNLVAAGITGRVALAITTAAEAGARGGVV